MTKRNHVLYWVATAFLAFGMLAQGIAQIMRTRAYVDIITTHLGYPIYFLTLIGIWKLLGVIAILVPGFTLLKEWAYAGFFFVMSGAVLSHLAVGDSLKDMAPALALLLFIFASWFLRPLNRRIRQ